MLSLIGTLLLSILKNPTIIAIGVGIIGAAGAWVHGRVSGSAAERNKAAAAKLAAAQDRIAMDREATAVESKATGQTNAEAKAEAQPWVRS